MFAPEYFLIVFLYISLFLLHQIRADKVSIFLILFITIFFALRGDCLPDYTSYQYFYKNWAPSDFGDASWLGGLEPGFGLIGFFLNQIGISFPFYLIIIQSVSVSLKFFTFRLALGSVGTIAIAIFFAKFFPFYELVTVRQGLAMSTGILFTYLHANKSKYALPLLFLTILIHAASSIFILVYFKKYIYPLVTSLKFILTICALFLLTNVVTYVIDAGNRLGVLPEVVTYYYYVANEVSEGASITSFQSVIKTLVGFIYFLIVFFHHKRLFNLSEFEKINFMLFSISNLMRVVFVDFAILAGRGSSILGLSECFISAIYYQSSKTNIRAIIFFYYLFQLLITLMLGSIYKDYWSIF